MENKINEGAVMLSHTVITECRVKGCRNLDVCAGSQAKSTWHGRVGLYNVTLCSSHEFIFNLPAEHVRFAPDGFIINWSYPEETTDAEMKEAVAGPGKILQGSGLDTGTSADALEKILQDNVLSLELQEFDEAVALLRRLHEQKAKRYGDSWCRRGEAGVYFNVMRKGDRLDELYQKVLRVGSAWQEAQGSDGDESLVDTIADLATYCIKWLGRTHVWRPEQLRHLMDYIDKLEQESR